MDFERHLRDLVTAGQIDPRDVKCMTVYRVISKYPGIHVRGCIDLASRKLDDLPDAERVAKRSVYTGIRILLDAGVIRSETMKLPTGQGIQTCKCLYISEKPPTPPTQRGIMVPYLTGGHRSKMVITTLGLEKVEELTSKGYNLTEICRMLHISQWHRDTEPNRSRIRVAVKKGKGRREDLKRIYADYRDVRDDGWKDGTAVLNEKILHRREERPESYGMTGSYPDDKKGEIAL